MAISKERLEELIEKDKVFYWVFNKEIRMLCNLSVPTYWKKNWELYGKDCFENKEDADFVAKYHTSRPEYFKPPTWEEFKLRKPYDYFIFTSKNGQYGLGIGAYYGEIIINNNGSVLFQEKFTKENYYKAVEKARQLFKGEGND